MKTHHVAWALLFLVFLAWGGKIFADADTHREPELSRIVFFVR